MTDTFASLRRNYLTKPLLNWVKRTLPPMSQTERDALEAGTVWWDAELFSGRPDWSVLLGTPAPQLTAEEQAFLDGPVEELCAMLDDWRITNQLHDLPPEVWAFLKKHRFFGMIIPKAHGGLEFSAYAHSAVVTKISTRSIAAAVTVMVPNSLGPAELLMHYGTDAQRDHYLPRLATGEEIPCFALTGPYAGSDAGAMRDYGVVCMGTHEGKETLGMRVSWEKRYITLGPVATVMGLAFKLSDPDHLLGDEEDLGITLALVPTDTDGVDIGARHAPAHQAFMNGPNQGNDVFLPMDWVIGGREQVGKGWRMLMESLAAGRSISLPSLSTGGVKLAAYATGAYGRVRGQFNVPIGKFEGVQEKLARIAGYAYSVEGLRRLTTTAVDRGEKPSVLSAIAKLHATERMRTAVTDAMDIHGGKGICDGPGNYLANVYHALPISITVEGANILTRSLIVFGQGAVRCHPFILDEMEAVTKDDPDEALAAFDSVIWRHAGHQMATLGRTLAYNLTGGRAAGTPVKGPTARHWRQLARVSASFALVAEWAFLTLGGALKRKENISARLGDVLSEMYLMSCVLKRFEDDGRPEEDIPVVDWCCEESLAVIEERLDGVLRNLPNRAVGWGLRPVLFPYGRRRKPPSDALTGQVADLLLAPTPTRERITSGIYIGGDDTPLAVLDQAMTTVIAADAVRGRMKAADTQTIEDALAAGVIDQSDVGTLEEAERLTREVIMVDDFAPDAYME